MNSQSVNVFGVSMNQKDRGLDLYDPTTGAGELTDAWLTDRATLLNLLVQRNTTDTTNPLSTTLSGGVARTYIDIATNTQVDTGSTSTTRSRVVFGTGSDDSYFGGAGADQLSVPVPPTSFLNMTFEQLTVTSHGSDGFLTRAFNAKHDASMTAANKKEFACAA